MIEPNKNLFDTDMCLVSNGIAVLELDKTFQIHVANFDETDKRLLTGQAVARMIPHSSNINEAYISHGELIGLVDDKTVLLYCKRIINARDASVVDENLHDNQNTHMAAEEKPVTAEHIDDDKKHHRYIRTMLKRHEEMWDGSIVDINVTGQHVDLVPGARPVKSQPGRSGHKARALKIF